MAARWEVTALCGYQLHDPRITDEGCICPRISHFQLCWWRA